MNAHNGLFFITNMIKINSYLAASYWEYLGNRRIVSQSSSIAFSHARTALKYGLQAHNIKAGDEVLLPDFICEVVVAPLDSFKITPIFYQTQADLKPNWADLKEKITAQSRAVMMVHYFGFPQDIERFQSFAKKHQLLLIDDNAHGFGGTHQGQLLGTFGDIGISSPRKTFPILNGAYLYVKGREVVCGDLPKQPFNIYKAQLKTWIKKILIYMPHIKNKLVPKVDYASQSGFREGSLPEYGMDIAAHRFLTKQNLIKIREKRMEIFNIWLRWIQKQGLDPVFKDCTEFVIPQLFAASTQSHHESKAWFNWGHKNGIAVHSWPTLPKTIVNENGSAMTIWRKLICFPIHQQMNPKRLTRVLNTLKGPVR
jgi:perosamine synthetase